MPKEGWALLGIGNWHYFRNQSSLCQEWHLTGNPGYVERVPVGIDPVHDHGALRPPDGSKVACEVCARIRDRELARPIEPTRV